MKDILKDKSLKEMPYSTPEGYFESLKAGLKMIPARERYRRRNIWRWAAAAAAAVLIASGTFFLGRYTESRGFAEDEHIVADASVMTEEDIIEYLINTGVEIEELEEY